MTEHQLDLSSYSHVVALTGAGVSVASGLPTYRGAKGLWQDENKRSLATADAIRERPDEVWSAFADMRQALRSAQPNAAHRAIAAMERAVVPGGSVVVLTQNIDGLHQRAGSSEVVELHGSLLRTRCTRESCSLVPFDDDSAPASSAPPCPECGDPQPFEAA